MGCAAAVSFEEFNRWWESNKDNRSKMGGAIAKGAKLKKVAPPGAHRCDFFSIFDSASKMMNFVFKTMYFASKMMNFVFKTMYFAQKLEPPVVLY